MNNQSTVSNQEDCYRGALFAIGGAADKTLVDFVRLAGGDKAHVAILLHATVVPVEKAEKLACQFRQLGVKDVSIIMPGTGTELPQGLTAVFIAGGDQMRLVHLLDKQLLTQLKSFFKAGGLIAGTSAGAVAMCHLMIGGGMSDGVIRPGSLIITPGLGLLDKVIIDSHAGQRSRDCRCLTAVALYPDVLCIGLDEDTAIHIFQGKVRVYGKRHVRLFRAANQEQCSLTVSKDYASASVSGVLVSFLVAGEEFEL